VPRVTEVLTVQTNVSFRVADGVLGDAFVASEIGFAEVSDGQAHLHTVVGAVDFRHVVLVVGYDHFACNKNIQGDSKFGHTAF
jgi:hypothetical protein